MQSIRSNQILLRITMCPPSLVYQIHTQKKGNCNFNLKINTKMLTLPLEICGLHSNKKGVYHNKINVQMITCISGNLLIWQESQESWLFNLLGDTNLTIHEDHFEIIIVESHFAILLISCPNTWGNGCSYFGILITWSSIR